MCASLASANIYWTGNFTETQQEGVYTVTVSATSEWFIINETQRIFFIGDITPEIPVLLTPENNNDSVFERRPVFTWQDGGGIPPEYYTINLTSSCDSIPPRNTTQHTYVSIEELCVDEQYTWTVKACIADNICSDWAEPFNFTIASILGITLEQASINFGELQPSTQTNTVTADTLGTISPLTIRNIGNIRIHTDIRAETALWTLQGLATRFFQYRQETNWVNLTSTYQRHTTNLLYNTTTDINIRIEAPIAEPPGEKNATVRILAEPAE